MQVSGRPDRRASQRDFTAIEERSVLSECSFKRMIAIERKRTERTWKPFVLMLVDAARQEPIERRRLLDRVMKALVATSRETDLVGWYQENTTVGAIFTGLALADTEPITGGIVKRVHSALHEELTSSEYRQVTISFHIFPDKWSRESSEETRSPELYPDLTISEDKRRFQLHLKRAMDIAGSLVLLLICAPLLATIGAAIRLTSKGPVLFRQQRVGQYGQFFTFLKFRTMYDNNDCRLHQEYVTRLINGSAEPIALNGSNDAVYKLAYDQRITPVGKVLRRTSLDELPQLFNVLRGEMSLVGPRPPVPYELAAYQVWHRRRLLQVKPGITGLWQVSGRSSVPFDEMVRMDLHYAATWSPWQDLKILLLTPGAVIKGAY